MCPSKIPEGGERGWIIPIGGAEDREYVGRESMDYGGLNPHSSRHSMESLATLGTGGTRMSTFAPEMTSNLGGLTKAKKLIYILAFFLCVVCL